MGVCFGWRCSLTEGCGSRGECRLPRWPGRRKLPRPGLSTSHCCFLARTDLEAATTDKSASSAAAAAPEWSRPAMDADEVFQSAAARSATGTMVRFEHRTEPKAAIRRSDRTPAYRPDKCGGRWDNFSSSYRFAISRLPLGTIKHVICCVNLFSGQPQVALARWLGYFNSRSQK